MSISGTLRLLPFPIRPQPTDTIATYIDRLAAANHLNPAHLHTYLRPPPDHRGRPDLDRLAAITGRTPEPFNTL